MKILTFMRYPKVTGTALAVVSLLAGATALETANFGASGWVFAPLLFWLATIGLPTTVAVLLLAATWGTTGPLYGFWFFCIVAAMLAVGAQVLFLKLVVNFAGGRYEN